MTEKRKYTATAEIRLTATQVERIAEKVKEGIIQYMEKTEPEVDKFMSYAEAAEFLGCARNTLYKKVGNNEIPYVIVGKKKKFLRKQLIEIVRRQSQTAV